MENENFKIIAATRTKRSTLKRRKKNNSNSSSKKFLAEKFLAKRGTGNNVEFLVKWYGLERNMSTWERASSFTANRVLGVAE